MTQEIYVIGMGVDGPAALQPALREHILRADFLAGGKRHLSYFPQARGERFVLTDNFPALADELLLRRGEQACVVLASGDPLFYGVGTWLLNAMGGKGIRVEPSVSSMQLAFARAGWSWQDAALGSVHGRDLRGNLLPLLGRRLIGLFTQDGDSPAAVARFFLERGLGDSTATVAENLGALDERVTHWRNLEELARQHFAPLNYLILRRPDPVPPCPDVEDNRALVPGVPDEAFARPEEGPEVMTRQEVRAVALGKLLIPTRPGETAWDIGAGLGTVSVELAVLRSDLEVLAVERDPARAALLRRNRANFGAYNIRVLEGAAPETLQAEAQRPRLVFLGGSGGRLAEILATIAGRLEEDGRLVASFVTLEHLALALQFVQSLGWPFEITEIHVARSAALAGLTGLKPQRGVFLLQAHRPCGGSQAPEGEPVQP